MAIRAAIEVPHMNSTVRAVLRRVALSLVILLVIAFLTLFGLIVGERGRAGLPARPLDAAGEALVRTFSYVVQHPASYYWHRQTTPAAQLVLTLLCRSAGLLGVALFFAVALGVPLGILAALSRRVRLAPLVVLLSILGTSVPSFLLGMLFWVANIQVYRWFSLNSGLLPQVGYGWDAHMIMPALVLATRPLAQIVQITYVSMSSVLKEDYVRTAQGKGLPPRIVLFRHALRNALTPILTTMGTSLRFSLASLPVVEFFFLWPGVGATLLEAINEGVAPLVTDLIVSLGLLFLLLNLALDVIYRVIDPRLRNGQQEEALEVERHSWREHLSDLGGAMADLAASARAALKVAFSRAHRAEPDPAPSLPQTQPSASPTAEAAACARPSQARHILQSAAGNLPLVAGTLLVLAFVAVAVFGPRLASANPYETHSVLYLEDAMGTPPYRPSPIFPWGSDVLGRDIQALVLAGARQTLTLALAATLARVCLGTVLGVLAGWWRGSWLDRLVSGAIDVWAAFPVTLFAMILILGLGIKQGMPVFVTALCIVGWGEIAQFVRGQVIALKPQPFIEAARAGGARSTRILTWHVLPHLVSPLVVLAVLETGGVLMLLAELGFLDIFLGGGFKAQLIGAGTGSFTYNFSDVPEWGALLANIRNYWRSYPWMAWYPGVAFFLAILAFNLWGEGLRRFLEETRINVARLLNRYTLVAVAVLAFGVAWGVRSASPMEQYRSQALKFDPERALADVGALASPEFDGREQGLPGARQAAEYIAQRMEEVGLFPAGEHDTYIQSLLRPVVHLSETPTLEVLDEQGRPAQAFVYREDYSEYIGSFATVGEGEGPVVGLAFGPDPETNDSDPFGLSEFDLAGKVVVTRVEAPQYLARMQPAGVLFVSDDPADIAKKRLCGGGGWSAYVRATTPALFITPQAADRLLASAGSSLAELDRTAEGLAVGRAAVTGQGATVHAAVVVRPSERADDEAYNVIGFIPGTGAEMRTDEGRNLDSQVILIAAYYDGLGRAPDGTLYPGANDNASGVAAMLEMARLLKESPYPPKKTVVFAAWAGGERGLGLSVTNIMNAKIGFALLPVEAVVEVSGLGAGDGQGLALGQATSFRLVQLFQDVASRLGVSITTRGRDPHFGLPSWPGFGGRDSLSAYISWDGSDATAHTPADSVEALDPAKLKQSGQTVLLAVSVLSREEKY